MPREATDLRERILRAAGMLFMQQGYAATSIKQIAQAAGCTTAALYYYFQGGKPDILREAMQIQGSDMFQTIQQACASAASLEEFLVCLLTNISAVAPEMERRMLWLELEAPQLADAQRQFISSQLGRVQGFFQEGLRRFLGESRATEALAWVAFCAFFGYQELALQGGMLAHVPLSRTEFARILAQTLQPPPAS